MFIAYDNDIISILYWNNNTLS